MTFMFAVGLYCGMCYQCVYLLHWPIVCPGKIFCVHKEAFRKLNSIEVVVGKAEKKGPFRRPWGR